MKYEYETALDLFPDQYAKVWVHALEQIDNHFERGLHDPELAELIEDDPGELHYKLFNEDYFIIGCSRGVEFLEDKGLKILAWVIDQELSNFGEVIEDMQRLTNEETLSNNFAYWAGEEILQGIIELLPNIEHFEEIIR